MAACRVCGNAEGNLTHLPREMMFGYREKFEYIECARCGCLQIAQPLADLSRYYPANYYSFQPHGPLKTWLRHQWGAFAWHGRNPFGWLVTRLHGPYHHMLCVKRSGAAFTDRILDVGCGAGHLICDMAHVGFSRVCGADPYIPAEIRHPGGPTVFKKDIHQVEGEFDMVMMHQSFEHMDRPLDVIRSAARLLRPGGRLMIGIPVAGSWAWKHYGLDWVQLDAPRHLFLHTTRSMELLTSQCGLRTREIFYYATEGTFWGSEQYKRDIPLFDPRSHGVNPRRSVFSAAEIAGFKKRAAELNAAGDGDLAMFYLVKE